MAYCPECEQEIKCLTVKSVEWLSVNKMGEWDRLFSDKDITNEYYCPECDYCFDVETLDDAMRILNDENDRD